MKRTRWFVIGGLAVALVLAFGVSRYASSEPDGLERVAADNGIDTDEADHALADGPFADYAAEGVEDEGLATGLAGVVGVAATFAVAGGAVWLLTRARPSRSGRDIAPYTAQYRGQNAEVDGRVS
jgi:hypothetical protein